MNLAKHLSRLLVFLRIVDKIESINIMNLAKQT